MTKQRSFLSAVKWAYTANWGESAFSAIFTFILAAILGPREFGILSIAIIYISFIQMFLDQGLVAALIQKKDLRTEHLDAVFWTDLFLSFGLVAVSISLSTWWSRVNSVPELPAIILALSVCIPIEALAIVQKTVLKKEMDFRSLSIRSNVSVLVAGIVGITLAYAGFGVWSLVVQQVVRDCVSLALLWKLSSWRPHFEFSWKHLKELLRFSGSNFLAQLGTFADLQKDAILLGIFFGPVAVGLYRLADRLMSAVLSAATTSIQAVSLPEFSRLQSQPDELRKSVLTCVRLSSIVTLPAMAGLAVVSGPLMIVLGKNWYLASDVLKILCVIGGLLIFTYFTGPMLQAMSKPHQLAMLEWGRAVISLVILMIAAFLVRRGAIEGQILGIALARLVTTTCIVTPVFLYILLRLSGLSFRELAGAVTPSFIAAVSVVLAVLGFRFLGWANDVRPVVVLTSQVLAGLFAGSAALLSFDKQLRFGVTSVFNRLQSI